MHAVLAGPTSHLSSAAGVTYTYDGDGKRVQKSNGRLYWYGAGSDPLDESDAGGNITMEYIFFGGKRIARVQLPAGTVNYYFADHVGTSRVVTNSTGTVLDDSDFYPFGGERVLVSSSGNTYKFTGKERDSESGLDNFGARYNSSSFGRFMSPDPSGLLAQKPANPQSWNLYALVLNNPLIFVDPDGLDCIYANDSSDGVESIDHDSDSGECGQNGGTWLSGYVDEDWAHYNHAAGAFEAASEDDNGQVNFAQFQAGAETNDSGNCLNGCGSYGFASASADWLTGQLVGNSKPTDGSDPLDGLLTFLTSRDKPVNDFWKVVAGPLDPSKNNWAGPGGMGPPGGTGDWRAAVHDYNLATNDLTIGSYFNPTLSPAVSKALIQSNGQLMKTRGFQGVKEKIVFGIVNAFQWYSNTWK